MAKINNITKKRSFFLVALGKQLVHGALLCFPLFNWSMLMKEKYRQFNFFGNNIQGLLHIAPLVQYQNEKRPTSQPETLLDEGFLGRAPLIDSLAFFNFVSWILLLISPPHYNNGLVLFRWRRCPEVHLAFRATQGSLSIGHRQALGLFTFG